MQPTPVGIENDLAVVGRASSSCGTRLPRERGVDLRGESTNLLRAYEARKKSSESDGGSHGGFEGCCPLMLMMKECLNYLWLNSILYTNFRRSYGTEYPLSSCCEFESALAPKSTYEPLELFESRISGKPAPSVQVIPKASESQE
jgi:hypothetical protein